MMKTLAIIPARGGSKRIPGKNTREFCGLPILAYAIRAAIGSGLFDEVMVSTDDEGIATVARAHGAAVPFMRSLRNADDHATTADVLVEVLAQYEEAGEQAEIACCLYPTAPFLTADVLRESYARLAGDPDAAGVIAVTRFSYPIQRALKIKDNRVAFFQPEHLRSRSQDLEPAFHDVGQFYWIRVVDFLQDRSLMSPRTAPFELPEWAVQDIDTEDDWRMAEVKFALLRDRESPPR